MDWDLIDMKYLKLLNPLEFINNKDILQGFFLLGQVGYKMSERIYRINILALSLYSIVEVHEQLKTKPQTKHKINLRNTVALAEPLLRAVVTFLIYQWQIMQDTDDHAGLMDVAQYNLVLQFLDLSLLLQSALHLKEAPFYRPGAVLSLVSICSYRGDAKFTQVICRGGLGLFSLVRGIANTTAVSFKKVCHPGDLIAGSKRGSNCTVNFNL
jgi:hypothetical protein